VVENPRNDSIWVKNEAGGNFALIIFACFLDASNSCLKRFDNFSKSIILHSRVETPC
jgi:hypothetical protein